MGKLRIVLGDQLSHNLAALEGVGAADTVLMMEVAAEATYVPHHKKKIAFIFSAMRHFAEELCAKNMNVRYIALDDPKNTQSFADEIKRAAVELTPEEVLITEPGEQRVRDVLEALKKELNVPLTILNDSRFYCKIDDFKDWADGKKQLVMEHFYRLLRKRENILMLDGKPVGGKWNYDHSNRGAYDGKVSVPKRVGVAPDDITRDVLALVEEKFASHFGTLNGFDFAVTAKDAAAQFDVFCRDVLPHFGAYQDAMVAGEPFMFHSLISQYLNCGLLLPRDVCAKVERAYHAGGVPVEAAEGFIRQILGWREYVRGIYWLKMPGYDQENFFNAKTPLPDFYWTGETEMACMREAIQATQKHAYAHHIQRLMITGNFALLAGLDVEQVCAWYLLVYADAYEWVELPNTLGMALFADGGLLATKPYAASGNYINKMSNYCDNCAFDVKQKTGDKACPFNYLYWDFMLRNEDKLENNRRLAYPYATLKRMSDDKKTAIKKSAKVFIESLG